MSGNHATLNNFERHKEFTLSKPTAQFARIFDAVVAKRQAEYVKPAADDGAKPLNHLVAAIYAIRRNLKSRQPYVVIPLDVDNLMDRDQAAHAAYAYAMEFMYHERGNDMLGFIIEGSMAQVMGESENEQLENHERFEDELTVAAYESYHDGISDEQMAKHECIRKVIYTAGYEFKTGKYYYDCESPVHNAATGKTTFRRNGYDREISERRVFFSHDTPSSFKYHATFLSELTTMFTMAGRNPFIVKRYQERRAETLAKMAIDLIKWLGDDE